MRTMRGAALAAALLLMALAPGCEGRKGAAGMVRSSALGTFPQETAALLVLEIKKIRALHPDAPWLKDMASLADREEGPLREVLRRIGPDVLARLDRLSLAVVPRTDRGVGYAVLAEGSFDGAKLREQLGGSDLQTVVENGGSDVSVALLPEGAVAIGPKQILGTMRANGASRGHGLDANPSILAPLEKVRPEAQLWGALDCRSLQRLFKEASAPGDFGGLTLDSAPVQSLVSIAFRGMIADSVDLDLLGQADAEVNAKRLADAARGLVALGRVGAGRDQAKEWFDFLDGIRIDQSGAGVNLRASIPAKTMESFVARMMSAPPPAAQAPPQGLAPSQGPAHALPTAPGQAARAPGKAPVTDGAPLSNPGTRTPHAQPPAAAPPVAAPPTAAPPAGSSPPAGSPIPPGPAPLDTPAPSAGAP